MARVARGLIGLAVAALLALPASAAGPEPGSSVINIVNETPSRVYYRVKLWQRDYAFVMAGHTAKVAVPNESSKLAAVEVEVYMRDPRDKCFAMVPINGSIVIVDKDVIIECKAKR